MNAVRKICYVGRFVLSYGVLAASLVSVLALAACSDGSDSAAAQQQDQEQTTVFFAGSVVVLTRPASEAIIEIFDADDRLLASAPPSDEGLTELGFFEFELPRGEEIYARVTDTGGLILVSEIYTLDRDLTAIELSLVPLFNIDLVLDRAFGGMMLELEDRAWLGIDAVDEDKRQADGVEINVEPAPRGGGALACDRQLTGGNVSVAPPCEQQYVRGLQYLAHYDMQDNNRPVEVTVSAYGAEKAYRVRPYTGALAYVKVRLGGYLDERSLKTDVGPGGRIVTTPDVLTCIGAITSYKYPTCEVRVVDGTSIRIEAIADAGYEFAGWIGCDVETTQNGRPTCIVTVDARESRIYAGFSSL